MINIFIITIGVVGLLIGGFLNVVIYRLPIMSKTFNIAIPRSHCPKCKTEISLWQNIPVISYILLRGKCYHCKANISWRYPAIELISCLVSTYIALYFGVDIKILPILILTWSLIAAIFIDIDHLILPDNITLPLIWIGLLINTNNMFATTKDSVIGAASGYFALWFIAYIFKLIRKIDGMGHGDFKLLSVFGAWLGWQTLPLILFAASLIGGIIGTVLILNKKYEFTKQLPFGPYLAVSGWIMFLFI